MSSGERTVSSAQLKVDDIAAVLGAPSCTVQVLPGVPTNRLIFGVNQDWAGGHWAPAGLLEPKMIAAIRSLGVGSLRFPAGTASQAFVQAPPAAAPPPPRI